DFNKADTSLIYSLEKTLGASILKRLFLVFVVDMEASLPECITKLCESSSEWKSIQSILQDRILVWQQIPFNKESKNLLGKLSLRLFEKYTNNKDISMILSG